MQKLKKNNKQIVHKKTTTSYISLPTNLVNDIKALELTSTQQSHSFKFIGILLRDSFREFENVTSFTPKSQSYLIKSFDDKYYKWLNILIQNNIIIRNNYYSSINSICYNYSINPIYFNSNNINYTFNTLCKEKTSKPLSIVGYKDIIKNYNIVNSLHTKTFESDIRELKIDYKRLEEIIKKRVKTISINDFKINEEINDPKIKISNPNGDSFFIKTNDAIKKAKDNNKSLINDNGRYIIQNEIEFINNKKASIYFTYSDSINKMKLESFRANRNETNQRLDTNLTNMCGLLVDDICEQNNLTQIDLNNSQFAILSFILSDKLNTNDFKRFKALSVSGELYNCIKEELGLETRKQAKSAMFEIMFSSRKNNSISKSKIKSLFPSVVKWIDDYKKENGDNVFSIMLQKKESEIFIDGIFSLIKKKKMFCLTKHDSLIVKENDEEKIIEIVKEYFNKINFEYNLSITKSSDLKLDNLKVEQEVVKDKTIQEINLKSPVLSLKEMIFRVKNNFLTANQAMKNIFIKEAEYWIDQDKINFYYGEIMKN